MSIFGKKITSPQIDFDLAVLRPMTLVGCRTSSKSVSLFFLHLFAGMLHPRLECHNDFIDHFPWVSQLVIGRFYLCVLCLAQKRRCTYLASNSAGNAAW
jgi:hypothetical protein